jgi:predicted transcriptional regulator of viral defense system
MNAFELRKKSINEEIDYIFLKNALREYANPRAKITRLLKDGALIRVKKGLYIFSDKFSNGPFVKETLANLIYGPSAISLQYALSFYGLIPEKVMTLTSITSKRDKLFNTPVGTFSYRYMHPKLYAIGIQQHYINDTHPVLLASKEKALADMLLFLAPTVKLSGLKEIEAYFFENLRIQSNLLNTIDTKTVKQIALAYRNKNVDLFYRWCQQKGRKS